MCLRKTIQLKVSVQLASEFRHMEDCADEQYTFLKSLIKNIILYFLSHIGYISPQI